MSKFIAETSKRETEIMEYGGGGMPVIPTFDLSVNISELKKQLKESLNKKSSTFIFLRRRENTKLELQREKVQHLTGLIDDLILINKSIVNYQAELFLSKAVFENIVKGFYAEAQRQAELKIFEHLNALSKIQDEAKERFLHLEALEIANLKERAAVRLANAKAGAEEVRVALMQDALNNLHLFSQPYRVYIWRAVITPGEKQPSDEIMDDEIREILKKHREAEAEKAAADARFRDEEVRAQRAKADNEDLKFQRAKNKPHDI